ncbi:MAG: transporter substrate-binding domain-containing protein [Desulfovibrio sp.]|jgi:signal transduction histidine kinase/CheY-like chemotaxis protein/HPt (histidine-containing phosphotransfer) domain-containing protein|nr:transporter substrate-binding domain-containing protein [Desulfovibrio sp.]
MKARERTNDRQPVLRRRFLPRFLALAFFLLTACFSAAAAQPEAQGGGFPKNFREIPGITREEIQAVEKVLATRKSFSFGMIESAECFHNDDGSIGGYSVSLAELMSQLFGVPFQVKVHLWNDLRRGIRDGSIDFSGDFYPTGKNAQGLLMSRPIRERSIKFVSRATGVPHPDDVSHAFMRVAFMRDSVSAALTVPHLRKKYGDKLVLMPVDNRQDVGNMLRRGELDMFVADDAWAELFIGKPGLAVDAFHPLLYKRVSVVTGNPELAPIVLAVNKSLPYHNVQHIYDLHRQGRIRFLHKVFVNNLDEEERRYYDMRIKTGLSVPVGTSPTNYPIEFYNEKEKRWDGMAFDILDEISKITGLSFRPVEFAKDNWPLLFKMLRSGDPDAPMLLDVGYNETRAKDFLFASKAYLTDHYALISAAGLKNLRHDEVLSHRVGLLQDSMFSEVFQQWFPSHSNTISFSSQSEEFAALEQGKIDLLMLSQLHFSYITNFLKRTNFKINMVFEEPLRTGFGFGKAQEELRGIISKAQDLVDTQSIVRRWEYSIFDYQSEDAQTRAILLASASALMLLVIVLLILLLGQRRREGNRLRALVAERTRELDKQVQITEAASESKSRFLANMSHDMRTPLNAIIGLSKLALTENQGVVESGNIRNIHNAGLTLLALVNDLLDISKIEAGHFELSPVAYETPALISSIAAMNVVRLAGKPVVFKLTLDDTLPVRLRGDDIRVQQVFNNLLSNAFKYTERGEVEWTLSWEQEGDSAWLISSVRDTGIGISPENQEKIFSDYTRIDAEVRKFESTGLGLPITRNLAKLMDGELKMKSEYGKGSVFFVRLRQGFIDAEPIGAELAKKLQSFQYAPAEEPDASRLVYRDLSHASALVVDDVESNLAVASGMLRRYGMRVDCVTGGREAIDLARAERVRYDLIFMDHMMPGMDGVEALRGIRAIGTEYAMNVPVVALTANAISGNKERLLENGFQAFLAKPLDMRLLEAVIARFIPDDAQARTKAPPATQTERLEAQVADTDNGRADEKSALSALLPLLQSAAAIPGMDVEAALKRFADAKDYWRALEVWARHTPGLVKKARAVSRERLGDYIIVIHGIKGSCLSIGATFAAGQAAELEEEARNGNFAFVTEKNGECIEMLERLLSDLSVLLEKGDGCREAKPLRDAPDAETFAKLKTACAAYDMDGVDAALAELEVYRYRTRQDLIDRLREHALTTDFARMAEELAQPEREE